MWREEMNSFKFTYSLQLAIMQISSQNSFSLNEVAWTITCILDTATWWENLRWTKGQNNQSKAKDVEPNDVKSSLDSF